MNTTKLNEWLAIAANLGVLAGIIFLAFEIQQNTESLQSTAFQSRTDNILEMRSLPVVPEYLVSALVKMNFVHFFCLPDESRIGDLSEEERISLNFYLTAESVRLDNLYIQGESGALDQDYFENSLLVIIGRFLPWLELFDIPQSELFNDRLELLNVEYPGEAGICNR